MQVFVNGRFLTQPVTGVQRCAREFLSEWSKRAESGRVVAPTLLCPPDAPPSPFPAIPSVRVGSHRGHLWEQMDLARHTRGGLLVSLCNTGPIAHPRQIVTIHDASAFAVPNSYSFAFRSWYRMLHRGLGRSAALVLTDSAFSANELTRWLGIDRRKTRVVHLGSEHVLAVEPDPTVIQRLGLERGTYMLTVSSRSPHKNLAALAAATRQLASDHVLVAAGGDNRRVFQSVERLGRGVIETGYLSDGELRALYEGAALFVYPSGYEGFGLPPVEAMACGCPVVVAHAASLPEVCGDAAEYCDGAAPTSIAEAMGRVLSDHALRARLIEAGRRRAAHFTWSRAADGLLAAVEEASPPWAA